MTKPSDEHVKDVFFNVKLGGAGVQELQGNVAFSWTISPADPYNDSNPVIQSISPDISILLPVILMCPLLQYLVDDIEIL